MIRFVHANYYMFSISSTRMIGLINPFFRLYYDPDVLSLFGGEPDIWPSHISKGALKSNDVNYKVDNRYDNSLNSEDEFIYEIKELNLEDVIYINGLLFDRISEVVGFADSSKIIKSLNVYIKGANSKINYKNLQKILEGNGYYFSKKSIYNDMAKSMTTPILTDNDKKYINYFLSIINKIEKNIKK